MLIDIRHQASKVTGIKFADEDRAGAAKVWKLENSPGPQVNIVTLDPKYTVHVKRTDIDNLIKALQKAKQEWTE